MSVGVTVMSLGLSLGLLLLRAIERWPKVAPQPVSGDQSTDVMYALYQAGHGLKLTGFWSWSIHSFYAGPLYMWSSVAGGKIGSGIGGGEWWFFGSYVLSMVLCVLALLYGAVAVYRSCGARSGVAALLGVGYLTLYSRDTGGQILERGLLSNFWGPMMATPMLLAAILCFVAYRRNGKFLGGVFLMTGLAFQVYGPVQIPALVIAVTASLGSVKLIRVNGFGAMLRRERWAVAGAVLGWWPMVARLFTEGPSAFRVGGVQWRSPGSYLSALHEAGEGYAFTGISWIAGIVPLVVTVIALLVFFLKPAKRAEAVLAILFSAVAVALTVMKHQEDFGTHAAGWYTSLLLFSGIWFVVAGAAWIVDRVVPNRYGTWGAALIAMTVLGLTILPLTTSEPVQSPSISNATEEVSAAMVRFASSIPEGPVNFVSEANPDGAENLMSTVAMLGHEVCLISDSLNVITPKTRPFMCGDGEFPDARTYAVRLDVEPTPPGEQEVLMLEMNQRGWRVTLLPAPSR